jgi:hypothetical protein
MAAQGALVMSRPGDREMLLIIVAVAGFIVAAVAIFWNLILAPAL